MEKNITQIENALLVGLVFLLPLVVLDTFVSLFLTGKLILLVAVVSLLFIMKSAKVFVRGSIKLTVGTFDFPVFLLAGAYLASAILITPNKMEAFFLPGTTTIVVAGAFLYYLINQIEPKMKAYMPMALYGSGVVVALIVLLASAGILKLLPGLPEAFGAETFTPLGGSLAGVIFLATVVPFGIDYLLKEKDAVKKAFWGVSLALVLFGATISIFNILPGKAASPNLPDYNTSWVVAIDSLKTSPLLGAGPGNYLSSFNRFRPLSYNQTNLWRLRFTSARSLYLTLITETGLLGMTAMILVVYSAAKLIKKDDKHNRLVGWSTKNNARIVALLILGGAMLLFPSNIVFWVILFVLLALNSEVSQIDLGGLSAGHAGNASLATKLPVIVIITPALIAVSVVGFYGKKAVMSEYYYKKALAATVSNQGGLAYDLFQKTININPYADRYHMSYAQVNFALANSIALNEELSDQDRQTIAQLVQQAIREGKATVSLNPQRAGNWELLASIYQAVIPLAEGADQFSVQSYNQAIALDPINPDLRVTLGNIYFAGGDYDSAIRILDLAVAAKPDFANARYNLAFALRERGAYDLAVQQMSVVLSLVDRDSQDYELAKEALTDLEEKRDAAVAEAQANGESLTPPQGAQEQVLTPPIELPADAEPPATPTPVPSPSPTPSLVP